MKQRPDFSRRSTELEIMDDLNCAGEVVDQTLRELEIINRWLGGNRLTMHAVTKMLKQAKNKTGAPVSIADLGCGSGDILKRIADLGRRHGLPMQLTGIDANPHIIAVAKKNCSAYPEITFEAIDVLGNDFRQRKFDIIIGTLFFHHFSDNTLVALFTRIKEQATLGIIINDIHRHWLAYHSIRLLTQLFSRSDMVKFDAPLSVLRAFNRYELEVLLSQSGIRTYQIQWKWAFRWEIRIRTHLDQS